LSGEVEEVGPDVGLDTLAIALFWIEQVNGQAQGQAIAINPYFTRAGCSLVLSGHIQGQPCRQFPLLRQVLLQLVAQMPGKGGTVQVEGVPGELVDGWIGGLGTGGDVQ
jgi:hypothetical protein